MNWKDFPCGECGAEPGEDCTPTCAVANMSFEEMEAQDESFAIATGAVLPSERTVDESLSVIAAAVHRLPFGGNVGLIGLGAPDRQDYTVQEYLDRLADWLAEYVEVATERVQALEVDSRRAIGMQIERDVLDGVIRRALEGVPA